MPRDASARVLPPAGRKQTKEIIQEIMDRFPETGILKARQLESTSPAPFDGLLPVRGEPTPFTTDPFSSTRFYAEPVTKDRGPKL